MLSPRAHVKNPWTSRHGGDSYIITRMMMTVPTVSRIHNTNIKRISQVIHLNMGIQENPLVTDLNDGTQGHPLDGRATQRDSSET
jgi:hypothetical protein